MKLISNFFKIVLSKRHLLKLISLVFAVLLWFYVLSSSPMEIEKKVVLQFNLPGGYVIGNQISREINVTYKGSRAFIRDVFASEEVIKIDLNKVPYKNKKKFNVRIHPSDVPAHFGVDVKKISPHKIPISLERNIRKKVPVKVHFTGEMDSQLKLVKYNLVPPKVMISGPINVMRKVGRLMTQSVDMSELIEDGEFKVDLVPVDSRISIKDLEDDRVTLKFDVKPKKANMKLNKVKIRYLATRRNFTSKSKFVSLSVLAPENMKQRFVKSKAQVIADIPENKSGSVTVKLKVTLPEHVHLLQIWPEYIKVNIL
jgi:YbbR domain-containing protein